MDISTNLALFTRLDAVAAALLFVTWIALGQLIDRAGPKFPSVSVLMMQYRREWMRQFVTRQPRIFDGTIIDSLRQGTTFFASACLIALGGGLALVGNSDRLIGLAGDLTLESANALVLEVKVLTVLVFLADALMKFVWSNRLFGYCAVVMASVPNDPADALAYHRAAQAAEINITAARNFNRGLRSVYFALGAMGWVVGAVPLMVTTAIVAALLWRREFASVSRGVLLDRRP